MFFDPKLLKSASLALSLVIQAVVLTYLAFFLGVWIDKHLSTAPYIQMASAFLGFSMGIYNLIIRLKNK